MNAAVPPRHAGCVCSLGEWGPSEHYIIDRAGLAFQASLGASHSTQACSYWINNQTFAIYSRDVQICFQTEAMKLNIFGLLELPGPGFKLKWALELNSSSNGFGLHSRDQRVAGMSSKLANSSPSTPRTASRALYFE